MPRRKSRISKSAKKHFAIASGALGAIAAGTYYRVRKNRDTNEVIVPKEPVLTEEDQNLRDYQLATIHDMTQELQDSLGYIKKIQPYVPEKCAKVWPILRYAEKLIKILETELKMYEQNKTYISNKLFIPFIQQSARGLLYIEAEFDKIARCFVQNTPVQKQINIYDKSLGA